MAANEHPSPLDRMPRHRARRRSPLRSDLPGKRDNPLPAPDPFGPARPVDAEAAAAFAEGMRAVAEVAELALTATALVLRELEARLPRQAPHQGD